MSSGGVRVSDIPRRPAGSSPDRPGAVVPAATAKSARQRPLPLALTRLVGRDRQVEQVVQLAERHRLVTLTGMGGVGKTRLAIAVAERVRSGGRPVVCIDLSSLPTEPGQGAAVDVAAAVAAVAAETANRTGRRRNPW
jgi:Mrp family chromosome partitioning ATPase